MRGASGDNRSWFVHAAGQDRLDRRVFRPDGDFGYQRADSMDICSVGSPLILPRRGLHFGGGLGEVRCSMTKRQRYASAAHSGKNILQVSGWLAEASSSAWNRELPGCVGTQRGVDRDDGGARSLQTA